MLRTGEVARMLGVSQNTVREYVRRGLLPCVFTPNDRRLFYENDVTEFQENHMVYTKAGGRKK